MERKKGTTTDVTGDDDTELVEGGDDDDDDDDDGGGGDEIAELMDIGLAYLKDQDKTAKREESEKLDIATGGDKEYEDDEGKA